jgi:hypothetical protein
MKRILDGEQLEQEAPATPHGSEVREDVPVALVKHQNVSA